MCAEGPPSTIEGPVGGPRRYIFISAEPHKSLNYRLNTAQSRIMKLQTFNVKQKVVEQ